MAILVHLELGVAQFPARPPDRTGVSRYSEWCLQPHQGFCVAGQDCRTSCPPAPRSQKAAAAASSCNVIAIYRIVYIPERTRPLADTRTILWLTLCPLVDLQHGGGLLEREPRPAAD